MEHRYELDEVTRLAPVAVGAPGQRTFFLIVGTDTEWLRVWLEKELLEALSIAVEQFQGSLVSEFLEEGETVSETAPVPVPKDLPSFEVEVAEIALGHDEEKAVLSLAVHPSGPRPLEWSELYLRVDFGLLKRFAAQSKALCAAGRPRCPLCGLPIDPEGHICPESN